MNTAIKELLDLLLARHDTLSAKMNDVTDPVQGRAIIMEMQEILHRADLVQNLLLVDTTNQLEAAIDRVREADTELEGQLKKIDDVAKFIKGVSGFLGFVDKAIDLAKKAAIL